ncbi:hypothetical protein [Achromobacter piechaudii]|uniref:hypothetical protein n=1 Tax=Achromobacter piechaudii TaxID=72556 RepID=UPI003DA7EBC4
MHCETCGAAHRGRGRLCDECTKTLSGISNEKKAPPAPFGFGTESKPLAPEYKKPLSKEGGWDRPTLVRTDVIPIALGGRPLKRWWLAACGLAGLAMTVGEVAFKWGVWWFWFVIPSAIAFSVGRSLLKRRFVRLVNLINVEADRSGSVYVTTIGGSCPVCNADIKLNDIGRSQRSKIVVQCTENKIHQWPFDPNRLESL